MLIRKIYVLPGNSNGCNWHADGHAIMCVRFGFRV